MALLLTRCEALLLALMYSTAPHTDVRRCSSHRCAALLLTQMCGTAPRTDVRHCSSHRCAALHLTLRGHDSNPPFGLKPYVFLVHGTVPHTDVRHFIKLCGDTVHFVVVGVVIVYKIYNLNLKLKI